MLPNLRIHLRDRDPHMVAAWRAVFADHADQVEISEGNVFADGIRADAIVSPANSFGLMDGGIDLAYSRYFGWELQDRLRDLLRADHDGELPVGQAVIVETRHDLFPFMVAAPTMRVPSDVSDTLNAYLAFRATLRAVAAHNRTHPIPVDSLLCPGLATLTGHMPYAKVARQMLAAYLIHVKGHINPSTDWHPILDRHHALVTGEPFRSTPPVSYTKESTL